MSCDRAYSVQLLLMAMIFATMTASVRRYATADSNVAVEPAWAKLSPRSWTCYAVTNNSESSILLTKPREIWVRNGDICEFSIITNGCERSVWMTVGPNYTLTPDHESNNRSCPPDHCTVQQSCRGATRTLTFLITFNDQFFGDEPMQIAYFINHENTVTNFTAHVYFEPKQKVESTDSSAATSNPGPLTTATTIAMEHEHNFNENKNCARSFSLNSVYVSNSILMLSVILVLDLSLNLVHGH